MAVSLGHAGASPGDTYTSSHGHGTAVKFTSSMPTLSWPGKELAILNPPGSIQDSIIFPQGVGYPEAAARDRLFLGDNAGIMAALCRSCRGASI